MALAGAVALVLGTLYAALAQAASASGLPVWGAIVPSLGRLLGSGHFAVIWWPRFMLAVGVLVVLARRDVTGLAGDLALVATPAVLLTSSLGSHAAAVAGWSPLAIAADWLHFVAVAAWLGGLASMVFVLPAVARAADSAGGALFAKPVARFSNVALVCVVTVALTGTFQAWLELGSWQALIQTAYGLSVSAKVALTVAMLGFGAFNLLFARPGLAARLGRRLAATRGTVRGFRRSIRVELAIGLVVLGVAAVLTGLAPGRGDLARQTGAQPAAVDQAINASATDTQIFALAGHRLTVTHSDGNPLASPVDVDAVPLGVGERADVEFTADNPGRWKLEAFVPALSQRGEILDLTDVVYEGHENDAAQDFPSVI